MKQIKISLTKINRFRIVTEDKRKLAEIEIYFKQNRVLISLSKRYDPTFGIGVKQNE